jgi:hypothetical protein
MLKVDQVKLKGKDFEIEENFGELKVNFDESNKIKKHFSSAPTYKPKNFNEQVVLFDDGTDKKLYLYINNVWVSITLT